VPSIVEVTRRSDGPRFSELLDRFERETGTPREPVREGESPDDVRRYYVTGADHHTAALGRVMDWLSPRDPHFDQHVGFAVGDA
jgi:hypothetical protein